MSTYAVHATQFVLPSKLAGEGYLLIHNGKFGPYAVDRPECKVIDLGDAIVGPGLVDTHIHGFYGHATTDRDPSGINEASVELARRGTTAWLPTTFTESTDHIASACVAIARADECRSYDFVGARIAGIYLEGPFFTMKHVGAQNPEHLVDPSVSTFDSWQRKAGGRIRKSALAPERDGSLEYIAALSGEGVVTCIGHSDATYAQALAAVHAGATCFVHTYNGMRGLHHREPGIVGCAMSTQATYAELICDGRHVSPAACEALVRAKGWEHVPLITDCLGCGGLPEGRYTSGGLPVVMKGGLCYLLNEDGTTGSIAGSVLTLAEGVKNMVDWGIVSQEQAIRMGSEVAARSAGVDREYGLILPGRDADFNVFEHDMSLRATYVGGQEVR